MYVISSVKARCLKEFKEKLKKEAAKGTASFNMGEKKLS